LSCVLVGVSTYLVIKLPKGYYFKFAAIPLMLALLGFSAYEADGVLGRPFHHTPDGEFTIMKYRVGGTAAKKEIELWIIQDGQSRLLSFPYSDDVAKKLQDAQQQAQRGGGMTMKGRASKQHGDDDQNLDLHVELMHITATLPKKDVKPD
jgi:hypothetical protein